MANINSNDIIYLTTAFAICTIKAHFHFACSNGFLFPS